MKYQLWWNKLWWFVIRLEQAHKLLLIRIKEILFILIPSHAPVTISFMAHIYFLKPTFKKGGRVSAFSKPSWFGHDFFERHIILTEDLPFWWQESFSVSSRDVISELRPTKAVRGGMSVRVSLVPEKKRRTCPRGGAMNKHIQLTQKTVPSRGELELIDSYPSRGLTRKAIVL